MRDHSPLKHVTVDANLFNFGHKLDVSLVSFNLRMGSPTLVFVEVMPINNRFIAAELRRHQSLLIS